MAFLNRVGNALKQTVSKHAASQFPAPSASLFQAIRSMSSSSKLFVGGLSYSTDEVSLKEAFSQYGEVVEARVILDRETGRSRGFGFITFTSTDAASSAIQAFDGQDLHGRRVRVNYATEKPRGGGFGGGGFGGGYGAGGGGYGGGSNYDGQGGNYGGYQGGGGNYSGGGYGSGSQYPSQGGGFGGSGNYPSGGGGGYGGGDSVQGDTNYSGVGSNYSSGQTGFSSSSFETTGGIGESQGALDGRQDGTGAADEDFGEDSFDKNENEEPSDYANNTRN